MAGKATSFVVGLETENDNVSKTEKKAKNLMSVLRSKYCNDNHNEDFRFGYFGGKPPKKRTNSEGDAELGYLTNVCVSNSKILTSGLQEQSIKSLCPNVVDLDISGNLLDSWSEILPLIQQLQSLKFLNVARNNITKNTDVLYECPSPLPNIENLVLNQTGVRWEEVLQLAKLLPKLKELHICRNNYKEVPEGKHHGLHSVECLRMNDNHITSWDEVWKLRQLPNLKSLILSGNPLVDVYYSGDDLDPDCKCSCHNDVTDNDNTAVNSGKPTEVADSDKVTVAVNSDRGNEEVQKPIDDEASQSVCVDDTTSFDNTTVADSKTLVETLQDEVRQYCENILNSVIDDAIRNDIITSDDTVIGDEESLLSQHGETDKSTAKDEDLQEQVDPDKEKTLEELSESLSEINDKVVCDSIEELSKEIVELILRNAFDVVREEIKGESDVQKDNTEQADPANENEEMKGQEMSNGGKSGGEEFTKEDNSCCLCEVETSSLKPFTSLETLCISETKIGKWKHLSALRTFPALKSVRIKNVKLGSKLNDEDRRKLFMASLPNVKQLNGSEVSHAEREKSERFLLRHFHEKKLKPDIYHILEKRHGQLAPLVDIDLSKGLTEYVSVRFIYQGKLAFTENICVRSLADTLRNLIAKKIDSSIMHAVLYHKLCNSQHGESVGELQELRGGLIPLSRLEILDGDEVIIDDSKISNVKVEYYLRDRQPDTI